MWIFVACADPGVDTAPHETATPHTADTGSTTAVPERGPVTLPFVTVGAPAPSATVPTSGAWTLDGPFSGVVADGVLTLTLTADRDAPGLHAGTLTDAWGSVPVSAVVGSAELPAAAWTEDDWGAVSVAPFATAPYPHGGAPYDDPSVLIAVPTAFRAEDPFGVVLHLHGHNATVADIVATQALREQLALSGRNAILIAPQGPEEAADSDFGRLETEDGAANLVRDVLSVLYRDGRLDRVAAAGTVLTSHSGGYQATASILQRGGIEVGAVHLFDSLYGYSSVYADFAASGRLVSVYTDGGGTDVENEDLRDTLEAAGVTVARHFDDATLDRADVIIGGSEASHNGCVSEDRNYARWLRASGLPVATDAAPELRSVVADGAEMIVTWRAEAGRNDVVETSPDGTTWTDVATSEVGTSRVPRAPYVRVRGTGAPSDVYGATGGDWWIVDGFDRVLGGSWTAPTHGFTADVLMDSGLAASTVSNEAVADGTVDLSDAAGVIWLLGDESTADHSFDEDEMAVIDTLVAAGVPLIVSGAEVGYATDADWLADTLGATYVSDDAGTTDVEGFTIGVAYPEDYPDVLQGDRTIWRYATGGAAAVATTGVVVVGFGIETVAPADRADAIAALVAAAE